MVILRVVLLNGFNFRKVILKILFVNINCVSVRSVLFHVTWIYRFIHNLPLNVIDGVPEADKNQVINWFFPWRDLHYFGIFTNFLVFSTST